MYSFNFFLEYIKYLCSINNSNKRESIQDKINMASNYKYGIGVEQDTQKAMELYSQVLRLTLFKYFAQFLLILSIISIVSDIFY